MPSGDDERALSRAHRRFAQHFTDPLYESQDDEFTPFGSDEGADMLADWDERRSELDGSKTVGFVLGDGDAEEGDAVILELAQSAPNEIDVAVLIVSAGFTLLRLTGSIDPAGATAVMAALTHLEAFYGPHTEFALMKSDVATFTSASGAASH